MITNSKTRKLTLMAMFAALAYVVMAVGRIPISSVDFLKYDPKDILLAICGFVLGPMPALAVTAAVSVLEMITVSSTGPIGLFMNLLSSAVFVCPAAALYKRRPSLRTAGLGLGLGVILMTGVMLLWNYFITPIYMGYPREAVAAMLLPVFLPFNLIKALLNGAITMLVYKPVSRALKQSSLMESRAAQASAPSPRRSAGAMLIAALVVVSCVAAILVMRGVI